MNTLLEQAIELVKADEPVEAMRLIKSGLNPSLKETYEFVTLLKEELQSRTSISIGLQESFERLTSGGKLEELIGKRNAFKLKAVMFEQQATVLREQVALVQKEIDKLLL